MNNTFHRIIHRFIVALPVLLHALVPVSAQSLTRLPDDKDISKGSLPDGIRYYIASGTSDVATTDYTLVQKCEDPFKRLDAKRIFLDTLSTFRGRRPIDFLRDNGIWHSRKGYVYTLDKAIVYSFKGVPAAKGADVADSLLLLVSNIIASESRVTALEDFAIIVSGKVDKAAISSKLKVFSLMIPPEGVEKVSYRPHGDLDLEGGEFSIHPASQSRVTVEYLAPRAPDEYLATIMPTVSEKMSREVSLVLERRLKTFMNTRQVPYFDISSSYTGSQTQGGDEQYTFSITTDPEHVEDVLGCYACILSATVKFGADLDELRDAEARGYEEARRSFARDNSSATSLCINNFLYGASLASEKSKYDFLISRPLADTVLVSTFHSHVKEICDNNHLSVTIRTSRTDIDEVSCKEEFLRLWDNVDVPYHLPDRHNFAFSYAQKGRAKVLMSRPDKSTGSLRYKLSNGISVYYKRVAGLDRYYYSLILPETLASRSLNLTPSEGPFIEDLFFHRDTLYTEDDFRAFLSRNKIVMNPRMSFDECSVSGSVPKQGIDSLSLVLQRLLSVNCLDRATFDYYKKYQKIGFVAESRSKDKALLDSMLFGTAAYTRYKTYSALEGLSYEDVSHCYETILSPAASSSLVLVGPDSDEEAQKIAGRCFSDLRSSGKAGKGLRHFSEYHPHLGESIVTQKGRSDKVNVLLSCPSTYTAENYFTAALAELALGDAVRKAFVGRGMSVEVSSDYRSVPEGRFLLYFELSKASKGSLSASATYDGPYLNLMHFRRCIADFAAKGVSAADLATYKSMLISVIDSRQSNPDYIINSISLRVSSKKDLLTDYKTKINAVSVKMISDFVAALVGGSTIEYLMEEE